MLLRCCSVVFFVGEVVVSLMVVCCGDVRFVVDSIMGGVLVRVCVKCVLFLCGLVKMMFIIMSCVLVWCR